MAKAAAHEWEFHARFRRNMHAYFHTMKAAENDGGVKETRQRIVNLVSKEASRERFVTKVLGRQLGLS